MNHERRLDLLLATHGPDGLERVARMQLPQERGVHYIVVWQIPADFEAATPPELMRDDIEIIRDDSIGVSHNHNIALRHAKAEYCLVADNDLRYYPGQLSRIIEAFDSRPDADLLTFRYDGDDPKYYPSEECDFSKKVPKGYNVTMFEVAFRRDAVVGKVDFNEDFGIAGRLFNCGIDDMFILESRKAGLRCRFVPMTIVRHDHGLTTGYRAITNPRTAMGLGAYLRQAHGIMGGLPRVLLTAWRRKRSRQMGFWWGLRYMTRGFFTPLTHRR